MLSPHGNVLICIDLQEGRLRDNVFNLHFERVFFVLKDFDQSYIIRVATTAKKVYNFTCSPHRISLLFRMRRDFVK